MTTPGHGTSGHAETTKKATVNGLAIVGFVALILVGMFLAIYAAGYVPEALSRLAGAVYLSPGAAENPDTTPSEEPEAPVVPPTTPPTTPATTTTSKPPVVSPNPPRVITTQVPVPLYGLPDLALTNVEAGYFRGATFVKDDSVPSGRDAAVTFRVTNIGTNLVSDWRVRVEIEGEEDAVGIGGLLRPQGYQTFTLRITDAEEDEDLQIDIDVDYQNRVAESNERNNDRSIELEIE